MSDVLKPATRAEFLEGPQRRYLLFPCPASGRVARIQSLTEGELAAFELAGYQRDKITEELLRDEEGRLIRKEQSIEDTRALMIIACLVDGEGLRLFSDADLPLVKRFDAADSLALYEAIYAHCRLAGREAAKKNGPTNSGTSDG